jgi:hypothetical protein
MGSAERVVCGTVLRKHPRVIVGVDRLDLAGCKPVADSYRSNIKVIVLASAEEADQPTTHY